LFARWFHGSCLASASSVWSKASSRD
jgi:hypothetical protein